ncbi:DUF1631 family protein [Ideonella sp. BN130291]|uniref:DUF1631 family protein n=1 Tax=Ideonella sp. BN130291 TaxID=3112940 RepID=UPI002E26F190|nr:DUF1631 family protein [Ideonella sp. BN130291]
MATSAASLTLATQARRLHTEELVKGMGGVVRHLAEAARELRGKPAEHAVAQRRRDVAEEIQRSIAAWQHAVVQGLQRALNHGLSAAKPSDLPPPGRQVLGDLSLVDDDTIEREILSSRLSLAIMDRASWEFSDLRSRISVLERREELDPQDMLRAHVMSRIVIDAWRAAGLSLDAWRELQATLQEELSLLVEEAYHETNRWLMSQGVLPEVDLRPMIRRTRESGATPSGQGGLGDATRFGGQPTGTFASRWTGTGQDPAATAVQEETRLMTRSPGFGRMPDHAEAVLGRLNRLIGRQLPAFADTAARAQPASPALRAAIAQVETSMRQQLRDTGPITEQITTPALLQQLDQRKRALKQAAETPIERATIEIVALLFQSILTEERIPATVRVWFARLQMPVLRVAIGEPDFFATVDHPARRLIDRMGACVMGFDASARAVGDALEKEIKRVVQVVEAYPDTGRRVFQTVLTEFERFLEHYFRNENEATRKGVSLAQQVEQRETLAIQYTIELRKMLEGVPVQEGVRQFLFQVWADVLAMAAVKSGPQSEDTKAMKRAATDLIWSAGAKVSREERAEVIRRLPPLLKTLREGMASAGLAQDKQDEQIHALNNALAAAFTAKSAVIPSDRLEELMERLETLEELLPDAEMQIDESLVLDLSGHESSELEVVAEGGSMPTPAMLAWARELQVGSWYMLDYRGRNEAVQLAWQGLRKQLSLFVTAQGRCVLFQQQRLAAFLQAGLLLPAQDEALTVRATRTALAKLDVDPARLLN